MKKLKDKTGKTRIIARVNRLKEGLPGDVASVGHGVSELRIHYGPGYRVYFHQQADRIIILLCGGDKSSQRQGIINARQVLTEWKKSHDRNIH